MENHSFCFLLNTSSSLNFVYPELFYGSVYVVYLSLEVTIIYNHCYSILGWYQLHSLKVLFILNQLELYQLQFRIQFYNFFVRNWFILDVSFYFYKCLIKNLKYLYMFSKFIHATKFVLKCDIYQINYFQIFSFKFVIC